MKITNLIDTHCHLNDELYKEEKLDSVEIIEKAYKGGVTKMISIGCTLEEIDKLLEPCKLYDYVYCSIGLHPLYINKDSNVEQLDILKKYKDNPNVVAVGECGLDYYHAKTLNDQALQQTFFIKQIEIAIHLKKPIVIHCRDAFDDLYKILLRFKKKVTGVIHCYTGDYEMAVKFIELGFYISFSGILTFKNAKDLQEIAKKLSLDNILVETDSPYLSPEPYRGLINTPSNVIFVVEKLASLKKLPITEIILTIEDNVKKLFNI